jgi:undecaprenyl-diphosphatase
LNLLHALVLGVIQGLTEFVPVSSSAHLVLIPKLLGWPEPSLPYLVLLHAATLVALLIYFGRELLGLVTGLARPGAQRKLVLLLAIASVPAAVFGLALRHQFESSFDQPVQVALELAATGLLLLGAEIWVRKMQAGAGPPESIAQSEQAIAGKLSPLGAFGVGVAQAVAIIPGISRSGATISGGLLAGLTRAQAARFSFLLSIPALFGASVLEIPRLSGSGLGAGPLLVGFAASLLCGYLAIAGMIGYLQKRSTVPFAIYCLVAGIGAALALSGR